MSLSGDYIIIIIINHYYIGNVDIFLKQLYSEFEKQIFGKFQYDGAELSPHPY